MGNRRSGGRGDWTPLAKPATARRREGLLSVRPKLRQIGGSNAQRDLFEQVLIEACVRAGLNQQAAALLSERLGSRGANRFATDRLERGSAFDARAAKIGS